MKINYYKDNNLTENHIDLHYNLIDGATKSILDYLESYDFILGKYEDSTKRIYPNDILYVEIVEKRCFAYLSNEVYQIDYNLKNFLERYTSLLIGLEGMIIGFVMGAAYLLLNRDIKKTYIVLLIMFIL